MDVESYDNFLYFFLENSLLNIHYRLSNGY